MKLFAAFESMWQRVGDWFRDAKWWVRYHTTHRHHLIDLRSQHHDYKYGWLDADSKLLYATMRIFCDFFEKEFVLGSVVWQSDEDEKIREIYMWWTETRPEMERTKRKLTEDWDKTPAGPHKEALLTELQNIDDLMDQEDQAALLWIVKTRHSLWT